MAHEGNKQWLRKWLRFEPHQIIGGEDRPYLRRWYVIPRNPVFNLYLHQFLRSDDDRALHDHPWYFASLILKGGYWEHRKDRLITGRSWRSAGSIAFRSPDTAHRVELATESVPICRVQGPDGDRTYYDTVELPTWTLIATGPRIRRWGFHCPKYWVHWEQFVHQNGCGEQ